MQTTVLHLLYSSSTWGRWVVVGCYIGSQYKKLKTTGYVCGNYHLLMEMRTP